MRRVFVATAIVLSALACGKSGVHTNTAGESAPDAADAAAAGSPDAAAPPGNDASAGDPFQRARTTTDLPDDAPGEWQVHVLYVEPSDRTAPRRLDEDGSIRRSITAWSAWLAARTGGPKLRIDTAGGLIDLTYVKLAAPFTEAAMAQGTTLAPNGPAFLRDRLQAELKKTFTDPKKLYLVYYDGLAFGRCGGAPLPPSLPGHFTSLYMGGIFSASFLTQPASAGVTQVTVYDPAAAGLPTSSGYKATLGTESVSVVGVSGTTVTLAAPLASAHAASEILVAETRAPDCRSNPFSPNGIALGYEDYSGAHETLHTLGIVSSAAKYHSTTAAAGHLNEASAGGTSDLMYQGTSPWGCSGNHVDPQSSPCVLDPAHENYFALPAGSAAIDLAKSVFVTPTPAGAVAPPSW